jgi:hypothetical protein
MEKINRLKEMKWETRGLVGWKIDDKEHGMYNHWDSYPDNLGRKVVNILIQLDLNRFKDNAKKVTFVKEEDKVEFCWQNKYQKFGNTSVGKQDLSSWYCLLREIQGAEVLKYIESGEVEHVLDCNDYHVWAYILNCDLNQLEVHHSGKCKIFSIEELKETNIEEIIKQMEGLYPPE